MQKFQKIAKVLKIITKEYTNMRKTIKEIQAS